MNLMIKDIPKEERPRERLIKYGKENLSNSELLSIVLKTGTRGENVNNLATRIIKEAGSLTNLKDITKERLLKIKGIGPTKAIEILATIELGKRIYMISENKKATVILNNSLIIYENNKHLFLDKKQECFYCLYLNSKKEMIERKLLFMGTINKSFVHPREIFKEAYLLSASAIVCMHNHPSGDVTPSTDDIILTKSLIEIGKLQQIPIVDHIIFGQDKYYSFYENDIHMG